MTFNPRIAEAKVPKYILKLIETSPRRQRGGRGLKGRGTTGKLCEIDHLPTGSFHDSSSWVDH